jgi:hypothetical protein
LPIPKDYHKIPDLIPNKLAHINGICPGDPFPSLRRELIQFTSVFEENGYFTQFHNIREITLGFKFLSVQNGMGDMVEFPAELEAIWEHVRKKGDYRMNERLVYIFMITGSPKVSSSAFALQKGGDASHDRVHFWAA